MRKSLILAVAAAALGAAGWYALGGRGHSRKGSRGAAPAVAASRGPIEDTVEATGSVAPLNRVEVKPPIQGRIEQLLADEGAAVEAGRILAWMSSSDRAAILDAARAQGPETLKQWSDSYKPTPIIAPLSGTVILRNAVVGQTVDPGTVLFAMSDSLIVVAQVDESDIGKIQEGMPARITLDAYPDRRVDGKVFDILYEGKNVSNVIQYGVKIKPARVPGYYRSQMTANVSFIARKKENALLVPAAAVKETPEGAKQVFVPGPDGKPAAKEIKTGIETGDQVEILAGLEAGDKVLLSVGKYVPQQAPASSPLTMGGRRTPSQPNGQAPRPRRGGS